MQHYDVVLKVLMRSSMTAITGKPVVRWLETQLPEVQNLQIDLLGETADGELVHIELQSANQAGMPFRMLRYLSLIVSVHARIPRQILVYAGRQALNMPGEFAWDRSRIAYDVIDMRDVDAEPLLASPEPSDNILAILGRFRDARREIRRILEKLAKLPQSERTEYFKALLIIANLRKLEKAVKQEQEKMLTFNLADNEVLGPAYLRGLEEGQHRGEEKAHEEQVLLILSLLIEKFGPVSDELEAKLHACSAEELRGIAIRVLRVSSPGELFQ